jgi:hypothetical protein
VATRGLGKKLLFSSVLLFIILVISECFAFGAILILRSRHYLYEVPRKTQTLDYASYKRTQNPVLGWPLKEGRDAPGGARRDTSGARRSPAFPQPDQPSCVSLYGDSFVEGVDVDDEHTWGNQLARMLDCRVANFGQAAYGTDQAFLRYQLNSRDTSKLVILGHMLENIRRNVNRNRDLVTGGRDYNVKPRFILDSHSALVLVPMPELTEDEYDRSVGLRSPLLEIPNENFQPGGELVAPIPRFPYLVSLIRSLGDYGVRARIHRNRPWYTELYEPKHPTKALEITTAIMRAFRDETVKRGAQGVILFLPPPEAVAYFQQTGIWLHSSLVEQLDHEHIPYLDFGPYLLSHLDAAPAAAYFAPSGHYNARGEALLAGMVASALKDRWGIAKASSQ